MCQGLYAKQYFIKMHLFVLSFILFLFKLWHGPSCRTKLTSFGVGCGLSEYILLHREKTSIKVTGNGLSLAYTIPHENLLKELILLLN